MTAFDTIKLSKQEVTKLVKKWGYTARFEGDEVEVHPHGGRGFFSYYTTDRADAVATARAEAVRKFTAWVDSGKLNEETRGALVKWFETHGVHWKEELFKAWITGNYGRHASDNVSSTLQQLRNGGGVNARAWVAEGEK
jgi:hypothetical protein